MIAFLRGYIAARFVDSVVVDVHGVGYRVFLSGRSLSKLPHNNEEVSILTYLQMRDDVPVLYGFLSQQEHDLFEKLISVSSVGPKVALSVLSTYDPDDVATAIVSQDLAAIQRVPGIGKKMASRIILELKDTLDATIQSSLPIESPSVAHAKNAVLEALLSMGFTSDEANLALKGSPEEASEALLLQYALKRLGA